MARERISDSKDHACSGASWPFEARAQQSACPCSWRARDPKKVAQSKRDMVAANSTDFVKASRCGLQRRTQLPIEARCSRTTTSGFRMPRGRPDRPSAASLVQLRRRPERSTVVTSTGPVVIVTIADPVQIGLVASLDSPGRQYDRRNVGHSVEVGPKLSRMLNARRFRANGMEKRMKPTNSPMHRLKPQRTVQPLLRRDQSIPRPALPCGTHNCSIAYLQICGYRMTAFPKCRIARPAALMIWTGCALWC